MAFQEKAPLVAKQSGGKDSLIFQINGIERSTESLAVSTERTQFTQNNAPAPEGGRKI
jgi:hypothetical protein